ncbi:MAG: hypothetical protein DMF92_01245 [Acidobacteria bacterium]|nr:MAG: hypothetical protein DMF92_01245 [Acidobacteriota bacterium]
MSGTSCFRPERRDRGVSLTNGSATVGHRKSGQVAGGVIHEGIFYPAIYDSRTGQISRLGSLGGVSNVFSGFATAINKFGEAVGYSYLDSTNRHAFLYRNGVMIDIASLGFGYSDAFDVNPIPSLTEANTRSSPLPLVLRHRSPLGECAAASKTLFSPAAWTIPVRGQLG